MQLGAVFGCRSGLPRRFKGGQLDTCELILDCLPTEQSIDRGDLHHLCGQRLGSALRDADFEAGIAELVGRGDIASSGRLIRRIECDFAESTLESAVELHLCSKAFLRVVGADPDYSVFHTSARGGAVGSGQFSRPDFTLATIRRPKYDPLRYLDVVTFELKNGAGTSLLAVHETLAHTRFAHRSYLICPRPRFHADRLQLIQNACAELGVGLITFALKSDSGEPRVSELLVALHPLRRNPDPTVIEQYLENRMPSEKLARLATMARPT